MNEKEAVDYAAYVFLFDIRRVTTIPPRSTTLTFTMKQTILHLAHAVPFRAAGDFSVRSFNFKTS